MFRDNNTTSSSADTIPNIQDVIKILWQKRMLMLKVMVASMALASTLIFLMPKTYKATATVVLMEQSPNLTDFQDITAGMKFDEMTVQTEVKLLNSLTVAMQTIKATGLDKTPEYASLANPQDVRDKFIRQLFIDPQTASRAIEVSFKSQDPVLAAEVANAQVDSYLSAQTELKKSQLTQLSKWFEEKITELKKDVLTKSKAVEDYRTKENLVIGKDDKEVIYQQIADTASQIVPIEVHQSDVRARLQAMHDGQGSQLDSTDDVVKSPLIQSLKTQESTAAQEVESLRSKYGPNHPKLREAEHELSQVHSAVVSEELHIRASIHNDNTATTGQMVALKKRLGTLNEQEQSLREKLITLKSLQAEEDASEKLLDNLLKNYQSVQSQFGFVRPNAILASPAVIPSTPAPPDKKLLLVIAAIFSVSLALAVAFITETLKGGLRNFNDVRRLLQKPLGIIPKITSPTEAILTGEYPIYTESLKRIYMSGLMNHSARTILVTSAMPKEGRTTFVISIAYYLKSLGHKVIVVDADFMHPSISKLTTAPSGIGFSDVLTNMASISDAIDIDRNGLDILRAGRQPLLSPDVLQAAKLQQIFGKLREHYDYIFVDSGPLLAHSEATAIAQQADGIMVVVEWIKTSQENVANMFSTLNMLSTPILGMVINKVDIGKYKAMSLGSDFLLPKLLPAA